MRVTIDPQLQVCTTSATTEFCRVLGKSMQLNALIENYSGPLTP
jgi:hypothetical protein